MPLAIHFKPNLDWFYLMIHLLSCEVRPLQGRGGLVLFDVCVYLTPSGSGGENRNVERGIRDAEN